MASAPPPASVLEVVGVHGGRVLITHEAAAVLAPSVGPLLPALMALIDAHKACQQPHSEHRYGDVVVRVVDTASAVVVGCQGEHVGSST